MGSDIFELTTYLFSTPTFAEGAGRLFDFANDLNAYNISEKIVDADARAALLDWLATGYDMFIALATSSDDLVPLSN